MQVIRYAHTEIKTRGINHRVGTFRYKDLGEGRPGAPDNYFLRLVWSQTDFFSPRHLHNFDQVRVQIEGQFDFAKDGKMKPGAIAYFPEGTPYGPQTSQDETVQLVMQIGGPSGTGYMSETQRIAAVDALAKIGRFSEGRYFGPGENGGKGVDSLQAAWEYATGQKMVRPPVRFQKPVLMNPEAIPWEQVSGDAASGAVAVRNVWDFGRKTVGVRVYRLAPGAALSLPGVLSCYVLSGAGQLQSASGGAKAEAYAARDVTHLTRGEAARYAAAEPTQLLVFLHPAFDTP